MKTLFVLTIIALVFSGCDSPFDIQSPAPQVRITMRSGQPVTLGDVLTAGIPELNDVQKSVMDIQYEWHRISSGGVDTVITSQSAGGANTYTIGKADFGGTIKVQAWFKYRNTALSSEDTVPVTIAAPQVKLIFYGRQPIRLGDILTAELTALTATQQSVFTIEYEWRRISSGGVDTVLSSGGANTRTLMVDDLGSTVTVRALFKYNGNELAAEDSLLVAIDTLYVNDFAEFKTALTAITRVSFLTIIANGVFSIDEPAAIPSSVIFDIANSVTMNANVTVAGGGKLAVSAGGILIISAGFQLTAMSGGGLELNNDTYIDLYGAIAIHSGGSLTGAPGAKIAMNSGASITGAPEFTDEGIYIWDESQLKWEKE